MPEEIDAGDAGAEPAVPDYEPGTIPLRPVVIVIAVLAIAAAGFAIYSCASSAVAGGVFTDAVAHYPSGSVTYLASGRTYLVHADDGLFLALSEIESSPADRQQGCIIRYRPDLNAAGQSGAFRDDCHGTLFNLTGVAAQGGVPPMQQHPVQVTGKSVSVRFTSCLAGDGSTTPVPCNQ